MRRESRANRVAFRRAVWASVALHALAACALVLLLRTGEERKPVQLRIDTHAADEPQVRMQLTLEESPVSVAAPPQPTLQPAPASKIVERVGAPSPALPNGPVSPASPRALPPELIALIRNTAAQPTGGTQPEVPAPPKAASAAITAPNVKPASGTSAALSPRAIHGALKPKQTVVYVLDGSGSMGAAGKFDAARAALVATLRQQPAAVRFQVIVYAGGAVPLLASDRRGLPATAANIKLAEEKLAALEARGRSNHLEAIREALAFGPDVILILTDADDLAPAPLRRLLAGASRPVLVCAGRVTPEGVERPREVK
jgi:hypothetical protein